MLKAANPVAAFADPQPPGHADRPGPDIRGLIAASQVFLLLLLGQRSQRPACRSLIVRERTGSTQLQRCPDSYPRAANVPVQTPRALLPQRNHRRVLAQSLAEG